MSSTLSPTLGRPGHQTRPGTRTDSQLYVIATHKVRDRSGHPPHRWVPYGVEHAWRPGSRKTLCGEWTSGWTVFWERRFSATPATACPRCVEASLPDASRRRLDPLRAVPAWPVTALIPTVDAPFARPLARPLTQGPGGLAVQPSGRDYGHVRCTWGGEG